jgi:hypothetical protein
LLSNVIQILLKPSRLFVFLYFASLILTWYQEHGLIHLELLDASVVVFPKIWEWVCFDFWCLIVFYFRSSIWFSVCLMVRSSVNCLLLPPFNFQKFVVWECIYFGLWKFVSATSLIVAAICVCLEQTYWIIGGQMVINPIIGTLHMEFGWFISVNLFLYLG